MYILYTIFNINQIIIIAAVSYIVTLQFCSGNTFVKRNAYKIKLVLTAQHAGVAQTFVRATYLSS